MKIIERIKNWLNPPISVGDVYQVNGGNVTYNIVFIGENSIETCEYEAHNDHRHWHQMHEKENFISRHRRIYEKNRGCGKSIIENKNSF